MGQPGDMSNRRRARAGRRHPVAASRVVTWGSSFTDGGLCDVCGQEATEVGEDSLDGQFSRCDEHYLGYDR
jgi:hypothetical protein